MAGKPPEPSLATDSQTAAGRRSGESVVSAAPATDPTQPEERIGPVVASRLRKADGRELILYSTTGERV
jgi:hypothetical protein